MEITKLNITLIVYAFKVNAKESFYVSLQRFLVFPHIRSNVLMNAEVVSPFNQSSVTVDIK